MTDMLSGDATPRLRLPLLHAGQAQKELDHNEALALLDMAVQPAVVAIGLNVPPPAPTAGESWVVGADPVDAWSGEAQSVAGWTLGGWRFLKPHAGMTVWLSENGLTAQYDGEQWQAGEVRAASLVLNGHSMLAAPQPPIASVTDGPTIDGEAREALEAVLETLRIHGLIQR